MAYGGRCKCCGEHRLAFLTMDHKIGGGGRHRKFLGGGSSRLYRWLRDSGYPPEFQVMCFNCNNARVYGVCPHRQRNP